MAVLTGTGKGVARNSQEALRLMKAAARGGCKQAVEFLESRADSEEFVVG